MSNNDFDMGFREYFYEHPCCNCNNISDYCKCRDGAWQGATVMILNRLGHIIVDGDCDCWEKKGYDNGF